ncbi:hypothetical protein ACFL6S_37210, partial [Candidatus Poribacteria bacterium]
MLGRISRWNCLFLILFLILTPFYSMARDAPKSPAGDGALDLRGGKQGYYYAEDIDDCFDNELLKNGMTFEFWFCPARYTDRGEWWSLVAKWPFYSIAIDHWLGTDGNETMRLHWGNIGGRNGLGLWEVAPGKDYSPIWYHIVYQGHLGANCFHGIMFLDGVSTGNFGGCSSPFSPDSDFPLYV